MRRGWPRSSPRMRLRRSVTVRSVVSWRPRLTAWSPCCRSPVPLRLADVRPVSSRYDPAGYGAVAVPVDGGIVYQVGHNWSAAERPVRVSGNGTRAYQDPVPASGVDTYLRSI